MWHEWYDQSLDVAQLWCYKPILSIIRDLTPVSLVVEVGVLCDGGILRGWCCHPPADLVCRLCCAGLAAGVRTPCLDLESGPLPCGCVPRVVVRESIVGSSAEFHSVV